MTAQCACVEDVVCGACMTGAVDPVTGAPTPPVDGEARTLATLRGMRERYPRSSFSLKMEEIDLLLRIADERDRLAALCTPPADDVREALVTHVCEECSTCGVHDGRHDRCCGCYDGVCCQEKRENLEVRERLYNIIRWGTENDEMRTVDRILAEVRPRGTVTDTNDVREAHRLADALTSVYQPRMIDAQAAALLRRFAAGVRPHGTVTDAPSRPTQDGGVWGSYVAYLRDLEAHVAAF